MPILHQINSSFLQIHINIISGMTDQIRSDQYTESTFMRYSHCPGGIVGNTLQPSTLTRWTISLQLKRDVVSLSDHYKQSTVTDHKEEVHLGSRPKPVIEIKYGKACYLH